MLNNLGFELSKLALRDINNIWIYTAGKWSKTQANKYYKEIFKKINTVCENPEVGKQIGYIKPNHRILKVKSHLIIYKIDKGIIFIDRILHERMDVENEIIK